MPPQSGIGESARWLIPAGALLLAAVSFVDDLRGLPQWGRLLVQAIAVIVAVPFLPGPVFQGLLWPWLDTVAAVLVCVATFPLSVTTYGYSRHSALWVSTHLCGCANGWRHSGCAGRVVTENPPGDGSRLPTAGLRPSCKHKRPKKAGVFTVNAVIYRPRSRRDVRNVEPLEAPFFSAKMGV